MVEIDVRYMSDSDPCGLDGLAESLVGRPSVSAGFGMGKRDMQFRVNESEVDQVLTKLKAHGFHAYRRPSPPEGDG